MPGPSAKLKKLISANQASTILVGDKPPRLGGVIKEMSRKDFSQSIGIELDENIYVENNFDLKNCDFSQSLYSELPDLTRHLDNYFNKIPNKLAICKMDELGYGLFATVDIPKDSLLAVYSGTLTKESSHTLFADETLGSKNSPVDMSCRYTRGFASFMQHLPTKPMGATCQDHSNYLNQLNPLNNTTAENVKLEVELLTIKFCDRKTLEKIVTQNTVMIPILYHGVPLTAFTAMNDIKAGDQVGFDYSYMYWVNRMTAPSFFDRTGAIVSPMKYQRTYGALFLNDEAFEGDYAELINGARNATQCFYYLDVKGNFTSLPSAELISRLYRVNALRLAVLPGVLPLQIHLLARDNSVAKQISLSNASDQEYILRLRHILGKNIVSKYAFQSTYAISLDWMLAVCLNDPSCIQPLLDVLQLCQSSFFELVNKVNGVQAISSPLLP